MLRVTLMRVPEPMRYQRLLLLVAFGAMLLQAQTDWPTYGHDPGASRFSPLKQIDTSNVDRLQRAWTFHSGKPGSEGIPIVVGGVMYVTAANGIFALEPETGRQLWHYEATQVALRGLAYWPGDKTTHPRVFAGVKGGMVAIDVTTGKPAAGFATEGLLDLKQGVLGGLPDARFSLQSPPAVFGNIVITGSSNGEGRPTAGAYGDVRGWDAYTGKLVWSFHTVPRPGEPGYETWPPDGWKNRSGTNAWGLMTVDVKRGIVYIPLGAPTSDFYGADRHGDGLYGNCLVALDAATGKLRWFQQLVHHDLWDFDPAAAPILFEVSTKWARCTRRSSNHKNGHSVHLRSGHGQTAVRNGGARRSAKYSAGRKDRSYATLPPEAAAALSHRVQERGDLQSNAGTRCLLPRSLRTESDADRPSLHTART